MMPDVTPLVAITVVAVVTGAALQAATGFGFGLLAAPLLFAATSPPEAVGLLMVLGLEVNALTLGSERRRPAPLRSESLRLIVWSLPGMVAGVVVLRGLDATALQIVVTAGVLTSLAVRRLRPGSGHPPRWALPSAGVLSGVLNTATSTAAPPLVLYLLRRRADPVAVRDTLTVVFFAFGLLGIVVLAATGTRDAVPTAAWLFGLIPLVALGHLAGRRGFARLVAGGQHELALTLTLVAAAVGGLLAVIF
jgi:uncharacterized protein